MSHVIEKIQVEIQNIIPGTDGHNLIKLRSSWSHETLLSFASDDDNELFREWWENEGLEFVSIYKMIKNGQKWTLPPFAIENACDGIKSELTAAMILNGPEDGFKEGFNTAMKRALTVVERYKNGEGLFQN